MSLHQSVYYRKWKIHISRLRHHSITSQHSQILLHSNSTQKATKQFSYCSKRIHNPMETSTKMLYNLRPPKNYRINPLNVPYNQSTCALFIQLHGNRNTALISDTYSSYEDAASNPLFALLYKTRFLTLRRLMSYIYGAPILDVSRSHTTTHHSR